MLSWTAWKERWNWPEGRLKAAGRWLFSRQAWSERGTWVREGIITRPVFTSLVVLAALFLTVTAIRNRHFYWDWLKGGTDGQIIVNSPTVYTRQRLVNDRLSQAAWLQRQLLAAEKNFRSVDQVFRSVEQRQLALGLRTDGSSADSEAKKPDQPAAADPILVEATTPAEFRAKNLYRDEIRAEITQTQLDDRHDISGNTIYRLAFDATIVAGSRRDSVAGIKITLSHKPYKTAAQRGAPGTPALDMVYREDYERLYADWVRHMQVQIATSVESMTAGISADTADAKVRQLLMRHLLSETCRLKLEVESPSSLNKECNPEQFAPNSLEYRDASNNLSATLRFISEQLRPNFRRREGRSRVAFDGRLIGILMTVDANYQNADTIDRNKILDGYYQFIRLYCAEANHKSYDLQSLFPHLNQKTSIACPFYDSPTERLKSGILIYDELARLKEARQGGAVANLVRELEQQREQSCPPYTQDEAFCFFTQQQTATRCFAAEFIKANLNRQNPNLWRQIDYLLSLQIVGRETNRCDLLVSATAHPSATVNELKYILNENTEAFAYSVTPKNLTENVATASDTRDTVEFLGRYGMGAANIGIVANQLQQRSSQMRAVLAHPVVVGFGSGTRKHEIIEHPEPLQHALNKDRKTVSIREIELGWVVAPRMRERGLEQIDNQYTLTTVISIPSWWRSVELDIETCWISRERLSAVRIEENGTLTVCQSFEKQPSKAVVRLPGAIYELSRKLGFDVMQEPYLTDNQRQVLEIGQPGALLLRGARLWRSTEVTLGAQKADNIVVLPNMDGIVAQFTCVVPQFRGSGYDHQPIDINAYVWTSEGVTTGAPVTLIWPPNPSAVAASPSSGSDKQSVDKLKIKWCPDLYPKPGTQ